MNTVTPITPAPRLYRFGPFEVDIARKELRKFGLRIRLERKPMHLLIALLDHAGEVVTRNNLHRTLWSEEVFVDFDKGLTVAVAKLRGALSDSPENPIYIETVAREGYRFIQQVESVFNSSPSFPSSREQELVSTSLVHHPLPPEAAEPRLRTAIPNRGTLLAAVAVCIGLIAVVGALLWTRNVPSVSPPNRKVMLVVLPFENLSGDPSQDYVSGGVTEELSERLGNLNPGKLGVIGRTSAMTYKNSPRTIRQIGKELSVDYVLEGSVRRVGNKVRITAQLVQVSDQVHVWAHDYDQQLRDLLVAEDEVASDIAEQVSVSIASERQPRSVPPHVVNPEAHEAYLLGRYYWYKRTPEGWKRGEEYFRDAIKTDPMYAAAYAGLAQCHIPKEEALAAARRSVELDPESAEAQTALGWVEFFQIWDFVGAAKALDTAVQLDPNYAPAHHTFSGVLEYSGRFQEAIDQEKQAVLLDPLALIFRASLAEELSVAGQNDRAVEQLNEIFAIDPQYPKAHETLGTIHLRERMYQQAIREFQAAEHYGGPQELAQIGFAYARLGDREKVSKILSELSNDDKTSPSGSTSFDLALVEVGIGDQDSALGWLEKEYQQHDDDGPWSTKVDPLFAPLRSDSRFQALLRRMKYPS